MQRDVARHRAGEDAVGPVVLVEGREDDHLVAGVDQAQHGGDHGLGRAARDGDLALGVDLAPEEGPVGLSDGSPQNRRAPRGGVLVVAVSHRLRRGLEQLRRRVEVGEALGEVDRLGAVELDAAARHLADHRLREAGRLV